jgi:hypothetical protein
VTEYLKTEGILRIFKKLECLDSLGDTDFWIKDSDYVVRVEFGGKLKFISIFGSEFNFDDVINDLPEDFVDLILFNLNFFNGS